MLEAVWKKGIPSILLMGMQIGAATMENSMGFLKKKLKIKLPYDPAIPLLHMYLEKMKTLISKDICTSVFTEALFAKDKTWKQSKCPSTDNLVQDGILAIKE